MSEKEAKSPNIHQRLLAVIADSGAVPKTGTQTMQGRFHFHEIDEVVDHLRPLFIKHGVLPVPSVISAGEREIPTIRKDGSQALDHKAELTLGVTFVNVDDPQDREGPVIAYGCGLDVSDKASGKAAAYALKNLLIPLFQLRGQPDNERDAGAPHQGQQGFTPPPPRHSNQRTPPSPQGVTPRSGGQPQGGHAPATSGGFPSQTPELVAKVVTLAGQGHTDAAWAAVGEHVQGARARFPNLYPISPSQIPVFYGKAKGSGVDVDAMKARVYTACGIDRDAPYDGDHLSLVPRVAADAIFALIDIGAV